MTNSEKQEYTVRKLFNNYFTHSGEPPEKCKIDDCNNPAFMLGYCFEYYMDYKEYLADMKRDDYYDGSDA